MIIRILSLGDSYTIGEAVAPAERWPVQLAAKLREAGLAVEEPQIIAGTGWRSDELLAAVEQVLPAGPFDLVTLLIGVNDQYQHRPLAVYQGSLRLLLERAAGLARNGSRGVLVLSIPDWGVTPFAQGRDRAQIAAQIDAFNAVNAAETERAGSWYLEITHLTREKAESPGWLAGDGLHPSGAMYAAWAASALPRAVQICPGDFA